MIYLKQNAAAGVSDIQEFNKNHINSIYCMMQYMLFFMEVHNENRKRVDDEKTVCLG